MNDVDSLQQKVCQNPVILGRGEKKETSVISIIKYVACASFIAYIAYTTQRIWLSIEYIKGNPEITNHRALLQLAKRVNPHFSDGSVCKKKPYVP